METVGSNLINFNNIKFKANNQSSDENIDLSKTHDTVLSKGFGTKTKIKVQNAILLPEYVIRNLKGDPDADFYEASKLSKIPYIVGGPVLALAFLIGAGRYRDNLTATKVSHKFKKAAIGIAAYYAGVMLAAKVVEKPLEWFKGLDINRPYRKIVSLRAQDKKGFSPKKVEYHSVYESSEFTRWDLLYKNGQKDSGEINENYDTLAQGFGVDKNLEDSDSLVKPHIKNIIRKVNAWKYALMVPFAALGVVIAQDNVWYEGWFKPSKFTLKSVPEILKKNVVDKFAVSIKNIWNGFGQGAISKAVGKAMIISAIAAPIIANINVLSEKHKNKQG